MAALHARLLARDALHVAIVGAIDAERAGRAARRGLRRICRPQAELDPVGPAPFLGLGGEEVIDLDVPQTTIRFGRPAPARDDADYIPAFVLAHILGGGTGLSSRLFREVREKRGLAYTAYAGLSTQDHASFLHRRHHDQERARARIARSDPRRDPRHGARTPSREEELEKGKRYLIGSYPLRFDTSTKIAGQLVQMQLDGYGMDWLVERNEAIRAVTVADAKPRRADAVRRRRAQRGDGGPAGGLRTSRTARRRLLDRRRRFRLAFEQLAQRLEFTRDPFAEFPADMVEERLVLGLRFGEADLHRGAAVLALAEAVAHQHLRRVGDWDQRRERHVVVRAPVKHLLDDDVIAMHAMIDDAGAAAAGRRLLANAVQRAPFRPQVRRREIVPDPRARGGDFERDDHARLVAGHLVALAILLAAPGLVEIAHPARQFADDVDGFQMRDKPLRI